MLNFDYIKNNPDFADLYTLCNAAEVNQVADPEKSAINGRRALEFEVRAIYLLKGFDVPERASLFELVDAEPFKNFINNPDLMMRLHYIRKAGNSSAHLGQVSKRESFFSLLNLYVFTGEILVKLGVISEFPPFNRSLVPGSAPLHVAPAKDVVPQASVIQKYEGKLNTTLETAKAKSDISEADTRRYFIDQMLREAGWSVLETEGSVMPSKACIEVQVSGMPNGQGVGFVDYVLFGANGKPLAVVEAKRTSKDAAVGRHQAQLYAQCLEKQYGVMPVIYYTNGYTTFVIDGLGYPPRRVYSYHTEADLQLLIQRRGRANINDLRIKDEITNRDYQKSAIKAVCEHFNAKHRRALLVMATGTGKTRVAISIVEMLMRNNWAKNVLFLADRTALVSQAHKNFVKLLPSATTCVLSDDSKPDKQARIMFSTYQTMINYIDSDVKDFSIGRFDLVIIDEAHRSVFGKYGSIFDYFDSLLLGLTATPREEVDRSTYELFEMEQGEPNFAYELQEAVNDGYLVPYRGLVRHSDKINNGIKYDDLTPEEKQQLEVVWEYEKTKELLDPDSDYHRDIRSNEIFSYIFNIDTVDKVLQDLMDNGLKIQSGEKLGKTIIFAYNHKHAEMIVERFGTLFPEYGADFCQLIDTYQTYSKDLLDHFEVAEQMPQIAVSVDMLDTGIDVPEVLNLVFFKVVKSKIKFIQMIGRGTRLCPNIFGPGKDKTCFYIFDYCNNFEYFNTHPQGIDGKQVISLTERLFGMRLDIAVALQHAQFQNDEFAKSLHDDLKQRLLSQTSKLKDTVINVRRNWDWVDKFRKSESWQYVSDVDAVNLKNHIAPLLPKQMNEEQALQFDFLMLQIELSMLDKTVNAQKSQQKVQKIAEMLENRASIPQVNAKMPLIREVQTSVFWDNKTLARLEHVRRELRELVQFLVGKGRNTFAIDIEDVISVGDEQDPILPQVSYKQRVIDYLAQNENNAVLQKIFKLEPLSRNDIQELERICWHDLGTRDEYDKNALNLTMRNNVAAFIRSIIGIDRTLAIHKFTQLISENNLNSMQEEYLKSILNYVCMNGDIAPETFSDEPFSEFEWYAAFGDKLNTLNDYVRQLHSVITA